MRGAVVMLLVAAGSAGADELDAELTAVGARPIVVESSFGLDVKLEGVVARVTERHAWKARDGRDDEAVYRFTLPADAVPIEVAVVLAGGHTAKGIVVDADAAVKALADPAAVEAKPDVALVRRISFSKTVDPDRVARLSRWEARVYPIAGRATEVRIGWLAPLHYDDGRLHLRIPGRGQAFPPPDVNLQVVAPAGARGLGEVSIGGKRVARDVGSPRGAWKARASGGGELVVEAAPRWPDERLRAILATSAIDGDSSAVLLALLAPPPQPRATPRYPRVVLLVDTSRSMAASGLKAARELARAVLQHVGPHTRVEAILYDRGARRVLGALAPNDAAAGKKIDRALGAVKPQNGSDLGAALEETRKLLAERRPDVEKGGGPGTLVVLLSDGLSPLALDGERALDRLGDATADDVQLVDVVLHPEGTAAPPTEALAAGQLAIRMGGRSIVVRDVDAAARKADVLAELSRPSPFSTFLVETGTAVLDGVRFPAELPAGTGVIALGRLRGKLPREVAVTAVQRGASVKVAPEGGGAELVGAALPLWLARAYVEDFVPPAERISDAIAIDVEYGADVWATARRGFLAAATRAHAATAESALVALDPQDGFGQERAASVKKWGPAVFQRLTPPPERLNGREPAPEARSTAKRQRHVPAAAAVARVQTGELDFTIVQRLMRQYFLPQAKACYDKALRGAPDLTGALDLTVELSRGEVTAAQVTTSSFPGTGPNADRSRALERCVVDAAFAIDVPRVALGDEPDDITLARYPLTFRVYKAGGVVTDDRRPAARPDRDDPLGGLPDQR